MDKTKPNFTPGPWKAWQNPNEIGTNYCRIRTTPFDSDGDTLHGYCGLPNAHLIAASPALYEALEEWIAAQDELRSITSRNFVAEVAQSQGRTGPVAQTNMGAEADARHRLATAEDVARTALRLARGE